MGAGPRADGLTAATLDEHTQDLHRLISELDVGLVDIFAGSGGAVNVLALVTPRADEVGALAAPRAAAGDRAP